MHRTATLTSCYGSLTGFLALVGGTVACNSEPAPVHGATSDSRSSKREAGVAKQAPSQEPVRAQQPSVFSRPDEPLREMLATAAIEQVSLGSGGRSLAFKLSFREELQGLFKPEQTFGANWYSELASYYLDRELKLGRVPPAIGRRIEWERLRVHAARDARVDEAIVRDGVVRGSLVWWIPTPLEPVALPEGWESWLRLESASYPTPFDRPEAYLRLRRRANGSMIPDAERPKFVDRAAELSDLILFDYLIDNVDRWGGGFTNVRTLGHGGVLIYLDNANGFAPRRRPSEVSEARLKFVQRFRRSTIEAIRHLDWRSLRRRMSADPLSPVLNESQWQDLDVRRRRLLAHVAEVERAHGSHALPW
jgi:hypothetical protein